MQKAIRKPKEKHPAMIHINGRSFFLNNVPILGDVVCRCGYSENPKYDYG